ncbi:MAG TPA: Panacea domain-containing protein [Pirellulales bacterium]
MRHPFHFDQKIASQAVAFLLRNEPGQRMNYMRLLKLLYLAERETLAEAGIPLTGSRTVALKRGPVLEDVFSLIRGEHPAAPEWSTYFTVENYEIRMTADPGLGRLSRFIAAKLGDVARRHRSDDEWQMVEITHRLPEWVKNDPGDSSKEIPLNDILAAVGREADLDKIISDARFDAMSIKFFSDDQPQTIQPQPAS